MIRDDGKLWDSLKVVAPIFECSDDGEELLVVNLVVALSRVYAFRSECHGVHQTVVAPLGENTAGREV